MEGQIGEEKIEKGQRSHSALHQAIEIYYCNLILKFMLSKIENCYFNRACILF